MASYGLEQLGTSMLNVAKNAVIYQAQIEKSLAVTSAVARSGTEGIKVLENAMINMANNAPIRFDLISASMYNMASAGLDVTEILETMNYYFLRLFLLQIKHKKNIFRHYNNKLKLESL